MSTKPPLLAYLADDFTGATDALQRLEVAGLRTVLFVEPPTAKELADAGFPAAVGVASHARSLPTGEMQRAIEPAFQRLRELGAQHYHYKVCSTFDSSPTVGSIGRAIDIGARVFGSAFVPVVVGTPPLGRWVAFGNLFASVGIGEETDVHRLDRHPSMTRHPVTPSDEADLRVILGRQTTMPIKSVDLRQLAGSPEQVKQALLATTDEQGCVAVVLDTVSDEHLAKIGTALKAIGSVEAPLFTVGSSAVETALAGAWSKKRPDHRSEQLAAAPALILVGSCSPITEQQVADARAAGVAAFDVATDEEVDENIVAIERLLARGVSVMVTSGQFQNRGSDDSVSPATIGGRFARLTHMCRSTLDDGLLVVAGGDTASHTVRQMGARWLTITSDGVSGAPICRLHGGGPSDGMQVMLKGGQVGRPSIFTELAVRPSEATQ